MQAWCRAWLTQQACLDLLAQGVLKPLGLASGPLSFCTILLLDAWRWVNVHLSILVSYASLAPFCDLASSVADIWKRSTHLWCGRRILCACADAAAPDSAVPANLATWLHSAAQA